MSLARATGCREPPWRVTSSRRVPSDEHDDPVARPRGPGTTSRDSAHLIRRTAARAPPSSRPAARPRRPAPPAGTCRRRSHAVAPDGHRLPEPDPPSPAGGPGSRADPPARGRFIAHRPASWGAWPRAVRSAGSLALVGLPGGCSSPAATPGCRGPGNRRTGSVNAAFSPVRSLTVRPVPPGAAPRWRPPRAARGGAAPPPAPLAPRR